MARKFYFEDLGIWASWVVMENMETGDRDVLPIGEEDKHDRGASCRCNPKSSIVGALLVTTHNSFDGREIVEEGEAILLGKVDP